ncbi:site-2 protease family protein [archaeon]|nr:site-2 protease family protein [archaeon]
MKEFAVFILLFIAIIGSYSYNFISIDLATFLLFILVLGLLIYRDRRKVDFDKIVFMRRTKKGRNFIDKTARNHRGFWKIVGVVGVIVAIPVLVFGSLFLISQAASVAAGAKEGGVRLLLPGPVSVPTSMPGVFVVPWWIWVIGVAIVIIPHEFMHGIMCRIDKVKIKSVGWILLVVIPGAFVEPDEKQLKKSKRSTKLKVYAAGSFANIATALIVLVIMASFFSVSFTNSGVYVNAINNTPAWNAGINGTITQIENYKISNEMELKSVLSNFSPGDTVMVSTLEGNAVVSQFRFSIDFLIPRPAAVTNNIAHNYTVMLENHPESSGAYLGVAVMAQSVSYNGESLYSYVMVSTLLMWIYIFSLGIGIVNMLPIKPLDGGLLFEEIVGKFTKHGKNIVRAVSIIMLIILLFNLIGPIFV